MGTIGRHCLVTVTGLVLAACSSENQTVNAGSGARGGSGGAPEQAVAGGTRASSVAKGGSTDSERAASTPATTGGNTEKNASTSNQAQRSAGGTTTSTQAKRATGGISGVITDPSSAGGTSSTGNGSSVVKRGTGGSPATGGSRTVGEKTGGTTGASVGSSNDRTAGGTAAMSSTSVTDPVDQSIPAPTKQSLEAAKGPLAVAEYKIPTPNGYKAGTVTYPTQGGSYPGVVVMTGYTGDQTKLAWICPRLASWGFVTVNLDTNTPTDDQAARATQIKAAATQLLSLSNSAGNPISGKLNGTLGVIGHSMGGGGAMLVLRDDERFKAGVPMAAYLTTTDCSLLAKPTFFLVCKEDTLVNPDQNSGRCYESMTKAEKLYLGIPGGHLCVEGGNGDKATQGKWIVSWLSLWLRNDTRFAPFLCGTESDADRNQSTLIKEWKDSCPY